MSHGPETGNDDGALRVSGGQRVADDDGDGLSGVRACGVSWDRVFLFLFPFFFRGESERFCGLQFLGWDWGLGWAERGREGMMILRGVFLMRRGRADWGGLQVDDCDRSGVLEFAGLEGEGWLAAQFGFEVERREKEELWR